MKGSPTTGIVRPFRRLAAAAVALALTSGCALTATDSSGVKAGAVRARDHAAAGSPAALATATAPLIAVAGDIACDPDDPSYNGGFGVKRLCRQRATSNLLLERPYDAVLTTGDNQYEDGNLADFNASYDTSWGRVKAKTRPTPGNHEYRSGSASGYFDYFGTRAGRRGRGWYAFDLGSWHLVALNSNCTRVGCGRRSAQAEWLRRNLNANDDRCELAFMHHPRFSSGQHGDNPAVGQLFRILHRHGVDVVVAGHDHNYERFAKLAPDGSRDPRGIHLFVAGMGGKNLRPFSSLARNSVFRDRSHLGVVQFRLRASSYTWRFIGMRGGTVDSGEGRCH